MAQVRVKLDVTGRVGSMTQTGLLAIRQVPKGVATPIPSVVQQQPVGTRQLQTEPACCEGDY